MVRGQASGENFYAALESAVSKLESGLRRVRTAGASRGQPHPDIGGRGDRGRRTTTAWRSAHRDADAPRRRRRRTDLGRRRHRAQPRQIVRIKEHKAPPMTVDDALYEMELVRHDFPVPRQGNHKPSVVPPACVRLRTDPPGRDALTAVCAGSTYRKHHCRGGYARTPPGSGRRPASVPCCPLRLPEYDGLRSML